MTLRDIIKKCLNYLGENVENNGGNDFDKSALALKLKNCANTCYGVIFSTFSRLIVIEDLLPVNNSIPYLSLSKRINRLISVKKDGFKIPFRLTESGIVVNTDNCVTLEYSYFADELTFDSNVILMDNISEFAFVYLIVSEYFLEEGDYEKARQFYDKFLSSKENLARNEVKNVRFKRWL